MRRVLLVLCVLALPGGAAAAARGDGMVPVEGGWQGETSAGLPIHFGVAAGRVVNTRFKFRWGFCGTYESHDPSASLEVDASGHWIYEDPRGQSFEATFVAPDRAEGKVISAGRELPGCPRTEATFTATPAPPNPESLAAARTGIEALPYEAHLRAPPGVKNALIGKVHGSLGESFRFFLFVNRSAAKRMPGVPGYGFHGPRDRIPDPGLMGGAVANTDVMLSTVPKKGATKAQVRQQNEILIAVEDSICLRQTGGTCSSGRWVE